MLQPSLIGAGAVNRSVWSVCGDKGVSISGHSGCQVGVQKKKKRGGQHGDRGPHVGLCLHVSRFGGCFYFTAML